MPDVIRNEEKWIDFIASETPEDSIPTDWAPPTHPSLSVADAELTVLLRNALVLKIFRPDRFLVIAKKLV